ncbi:hypothetical protein BC941DRAFT_414753 [Chlamydoabsidia padenii]|nr:hypothetical protein BC941DRAFT_414753 [Chlamydoabsidia padenii]
MSLSLSSTCYNNLGLGRWEELCHEFMSSVLPMDDPGMSVDDLSSPTWRIIFLKDDCFLQPSYELTCSPSSTTFNNNTSTTASPSNSIEPLFDGIDMNHPDPHRLITPSRSEPRKRKSHPVKKQQGQQKKRRKQQTMTHRHSVSGDNNCTLFDQLTLAGIDWCRYCGTTEGVNWRPGPWGKRTLCNKHGCDYKGYGLASRLPRLDLSGYRHELVQDRHRPVIQDFCSICQKRGEEDNENQQLFLCDGGCSRAFHRHCFSMTDQEQDDMTSLWFCGPTCSENRKKKRVVVDLPRKQPLMGPLK